MHFPTLPQQTNEDITMKLVFWTTAIHSSSASQSN
jgi:hypothetical protein